MSLFDRFIAGEALQIDDQVRSETPERFVQLEDGYTYVEQSGPAAAETIILIHGFSVPNFIWDPTFEALVAQGFNVIRYDLFGRGLSDRPVVRYDLALFRRQLEELIQALNLPSKINLLSLSMGAVIAADFSGHHPERIARLGFIGPAGFDLEFPWQANLLRVPIAGEILLGSFDRFGRQSLLEGMLSDFYNPSQEAKDYFIPRYMQQMQYQGFKRALLSTLRQNVLSAQLHLFETIANQEFPVLLIWGEHDQTVPYKHHRAFQQIIPRTQFHPIAQAGHIPYFEHPQLVNPLIIDFFQR